jgi:hypothetical protein
MTDTRRDPALVAASRPPKRPPHLVLGILVGGAIGFSIGTLLVLLVGDATITGRRDDVFTYIFGLPGLLSVPAGVVGAFVSLFRYADDPDVPVRTGAHGETVVDPDLVSSTATRPGEEERVDERELAHHHAPR